MTANLDLMLRLADEVDADDKRMSEAPWIVEADVLYTAPPGGPTIHLAEFLGEAMIEDDAAVARVRNNLREMAEQLRLAAEEIRTMRMEAEYERSQGVYAATMAASGGAG